MSDDSIEIQGVSKQRLKALPDMPGVYLMKDEQGEVIYVGKAKSLRSRVSSYFAGGDGRANVVYILERVRTIDTLVTETERQAIVLENDLIKKYKPRYNIRLKDDKAHLIVRIDRRHEWPRIELVRAVAEDGAQYIGPFAFSYELRTMLDVIKRSLPLRTCSNTMLYNRVRPCLEYQIKRCAGPCCLEVDSEDYADWLRQAVQILEGNVSDVISDLEHSMERASEALRFEDAAIMRDRIAVLKRIGQEATESNYGTGSLDAFGLYREGNKFEVSVVMVRQGRLFESKTYGFEDINALDDEIMSSLLSQFYSGKRQIAETILIPFELEDRESREEYYSDIRGKKVSIALPQRGSKARLLALANQNAKENFEARFSGLDKSTRVLEAIQADFELEQMPRTIECVDVSHFQGGSTVASVVCFKDAQPEKGRYRVFHLSQEGKPDDFASMREVIRRHLSRCAEENTLCDLLVVDGGQAQLSQALAVRKELGLQTPAMVGLAKKRTASIPYRKAAAKSGKGKAKGKRITLEKPERIYVQERSVPVLLNPRSEAMQLFERIRNEAHRFAIQFHRKTRAKKSVRSVLDGIPGVGPNRKRELLRVFRSVDAIRKANPEELVERCKIPFSLAVKIIQSLNP
jgi:excinuclease ABC subunit C